MIRPDGHPHHPEDGWADEGHPLTVQWARRVEVTEWDAQKTYPWNELIRPHKEIARKEDAPLWSFCLVKDRARKSGSVTHATALVYDFDGKGGRKFPDVVDSLLGVRWWAHTTWSHTEEDHAFRLILPVDIAIPVEDYREALEAVANAYNLHGRDPSCKDPGRLYYAPSCKPGADPWLEYMDGDFTHWVAWVNHARTLAAKKAEASKALPPRRMSRREATQTPEFRRQVYRNIAEGLLEKMDPDAPHDEWLGACFAIGQTLGEEGMQMVEAWSRRGTKFDPRQMQSIRRRLGLG